MSSTIVVVGAGIIGLTTAVRLLESGHGVIILARDLPGDPITPVYASPCAGAHHVSFASDDDLRQRKLDLRTFQVMWEQLHSPKDGEEEEGAALLQVNQIEYYNVPNTKHIQIYEDMPDFKVLDEHSSQWTRVVQFTTLTMDTAPYLAALVKRIQSLGGILTRADLPALSTVFQHQSIEKKTVKAIVNCTGLGSLHLGDVSDANVHPVRGHVIIVNAPWIKHCCTIQDHSSKDLKDKVRTYVIARKSGEVVIGGTRQVGDWTVAPDETISKSIKKQALVLLPELSPSYEPGSNRVPEPEELDTIVVREVVGFRPGRTGGIRLERGDDLKDIPVFHNYGHSGAGWQSSWACAEEVVRLFNEAQVA